MPKVLLLRTWTDIEGATYAPNLGLMYLASLVRRYKRNCEVDILDLNVQRLHLHERIKQIEKYSPDVIGITSMSYEATTVHKAAAHLKQALPEVKIIVGGPYPSCSALRSVSDPNIDFAVFGEGEETFIELLDKIFSRATDFRSVKGIAFRYLGKPLQTLPRPFIQDLDSIPYPAWDLIDIDAYGKVPRWHYLFAEKRYMPIFTSRACPYGCTYCHNVFGKNFRARSPQNVFEEIKILYERYGIKEIQIFDDIFNVQTRRAIEICDLIINSGMKIFISFPNGLRGDILTDELLVKMKKAGCYKIAYAIETATPRLQTILKKNVKLDRMKQVIEKTDEVGILTHGFFMIGLPTETREEVMNTVHYALSSKLHFGGFYFLDPFEGTEMAEWAAKLRPGLMEKEEHSFFSSDRQLSEVPTAELEKIHRDLYRKFYFNPKRAWRAFILLPKKRLILFLAKLWLEKAFEAFKPKVHREDSLTKTNLNQYKGKNEGDKAEPLGSI